MSRKELDCMMSFSSDCGGEKFVVCEKHLMEFKNFKPKKQSKKEQKEYQQKLKKIIEYFKTPM